MNEGIRESVEVGATDVQAVVGAQRRRRRLRFWLGFAVIALVGGLWAGLTKDPIDPRLFDDGFVEEVPAIEIGEFEDFEVPTTTVGPIEPAEPAETTVTGPAPTPTTSAP